MGEQSREPTNDEIRARWAKATPGPWTASPRSVGQTVENDEMAGLGFDIEGPPEPMLRGQFARGADADAIAHAPTDVAALTARAEAAERRVVAAREAVAELRATLALPDMTAPFTLAYVHGHITSTETVARLVAAWDAVEAALAAPAPGATTEEDADAHA